MEIKEKKLLNIYDNLFHPINKKDYGLYWNVSNNKTKPLANAEALLKYVRKESKEGSYININANLDNDLILENTIYLDFDLTNNSYLKAEKSLTETVLEELVKEEVDVDKAINISKKNGNVILKQIQDKYNKSYSIDNGFIKGYNNFIDSLTQSEEGVLKDLVDSKQKEETEGKSEKEIQQYYINKFEQDYLKEPFKEATTVAKYLNHIGVKTFLNWSGSKGLHLRIPITTITFEGTELEENPENVKLFLVALAELIEEKILEKPKRKSSVDYAVFKKGIQRIPCSKHNKTKLYANFIKPSINYIEAIDYLGVKEPVYIPEVIDSEENTKTLIESDIYKATIKKATEETTKTFKSEGVNPNYKFKGEHKELLEIISKVYLPSVRNEVGFRIVHLLKRSNFSKEEVESIFKELHEDFTDYKKTIQGSINHAYKTEKLTGLRSLIKWLNDNASEEVKDKVIDYFKKKFNYYEVPEETVIEDTLTINEQEYNLTEIATSKKKYYILKDFEAEGTNIEINKEKAVIYVKQQSKLIAKLELKTKEGKALEGIVASSKDKLNKFIKRITAKTDLTKEIIEEALTELDLYFSYMEEQEEEEQELQQQEEEIITEIEENPDFIKFGETEEGFYSQVNFDKNKGIYYNYYVKTAEGYDTKRKPIANAIIKDVTIILDSLGILEPVYNVTYTNLTFDTEKTVEHLTKKQLTEEFIKANVFYYSTKESVDTVLNAFIIDGTKADRIKTKTEAYLEGFFMVNNKVVSNTNLKNIKKPSKEELAEAIKLLNEIMKDRTAEGKANDSTVYRFMLWSPFSYCFKQLGYGKANYSLILIGASQTNKTGATKIGNLFYNRNEEETTGSTVSVLGSKIGENSFCSAFDECSHLFFIMEALNVMKRAVYEKTGRAVKDRNDNTKIDEFIALNLPIFLLNPEGIIFKDFIKNRYKIINYSLESFITEEAVEEFNKKYVPEGEGTILKKLALIGKVFSEKLIAIIENPTERKKLFNIEGLTIDILKEIQAEAGVNFLPEMLTTTEASTKYNYNVVEEIPKILNAEFKQKNRLMANSSYTGFSFVNSITNNDFPFITYNRNRTANKTQHKEFIINTSKLTDYINNKTEEYVELETILEALNLTDILKAKPDYKPKPNISESEEKEYYKQYIKKQHKIKIKDTSTEELKDKVISGIYLTSEELANNLFDFDFDFSEEENEKSKK